LNDPQLLLKAYFAGDFTRPFGKLHNALIDAIWQTAMYGGKIAVAAPRGRGKTTVVKKTLVAVVLAGFIRFPVPIGPTTDHARELYEDFRRSFMFNDLLLEDFPEICAPVRALEGAPQRASKQHIDGQLTRIRWTADGLRLADVPAKYRGPIDYGGVRLEYRGLDAAIRGINRDGDRPDFVPIDEPETRESSKSDSQIADRENALEKDIAGLAGEDKELAQVMITTIQNRKCISFQYTDPEQKPSWMGKRFGWVEKWPEEWTKEDGLWHEYIALRGQDQRTGDRYGRSATEFYLANREALEKGGELLADNYKAIVLSDGWVTVHSAWQVVFNTIADTSYDAFCTEYQNDPPEVEQIQTIDLSHSHVASCHSGLNQKQIPDWAKLVLRGIDMGKVNCHYVDIAFAMDGTGAVVDYGRFTTHGLASNSTDEAIELAMLNALQAFAIEHDSYPIDLAFVDSGYKPEAVYEACRRIGNKYKPLKGLDGSYRMPKASDTVQCWFECHASQIYDQYRRPLWLFHPNTEHWKNWLQERWMQDPFVGGQLTRGSMTVFDPPGGDIKFHQTFARSMVSERLEHIPIPGGGYKSIWNVIDRGNNHYLDAAGYACAAAACLGVRLVPTTETSRPARQSQKVRPASDKQSVSSSNRFRNRPGGWIKGIKRGR
jgi:Phage terminase large subunit (GpA)